MQTEVAVEQLDNCDLCGASLGMALPLCEVDGWRVVQCVSCGLGITNPRPSLAEIGHYYKNSFYRFSPVPEANLIDEIRTMWHQDKKLISGLIQHWIKEHLKQRFFTLSAGKSNQEKFSYSERATLYILKCLLEPIVTIPYVPDGNILDIGFGRGEFLLRAKRVGWNVFGVDTSSTGVEVGESLGLQAKLFDGSFKTALDFPTNFFDAVIMQNVLEHAHSPTLAVRECYRLVKPGGLVIIVVPNLDSYDRRTIGPAWSLWSTPQHLFHFNMETLQRLVQAAGLTTTKIFHKKWYAIQTEKASLMRLAQILRSQTSSSISQPVVYAKLSKIAFKILIGKRLRYIFGSLTEQQFSQAIALYAIK